jgi:hypothetical protein
MQKRISKKAEKLLHAIDHCSRLSTGNVCSWGSIAKVPEPPVTDFPLRDAPSDNRRSIYPQVASEVASELSAGWNNLSSGRLVPQQAGEAKLPDGGLASCIGTALRTASLYQEMVSRRAPHRWPCQNVHPLKAYQHI